MNYDEYPSWLAAVPEHERAELLRVWEATLLARGERPSADAVDAAADRFWTSTTDRPIPDPPAPNAPAPAFPNADRQPTGPDRRTRRHTLARALGAVALVATGLALGLALRTGGGSSLPAPSDGQSSFMVLIRGGTFDERTPQEQAQMVAAFRDWAGELARMNRLRAGEQLAEDGHVLAHADGDVAARPYRSPEDGVGGYFVIMAKDYAEALDLARGCPQLRFGGSVEVRRIIND
jgi:hypothetical protein